MWINDNGGYDYAVQRVSDRCYIVDGEKTFQYFPIYDAEHHVSWTHDPECALTVDSADVDESWPRTLGDLLLDFGELLISPEDAKRAVEHEDEWREKDAWSISQSLLKPEYRLVRIPFVNYDLMVADENGEPYGDGDDEDEDLGPFWVDEDTPDWVAIRNYVFGEGGAIAAEGEHVPEDAPWAAGSDEEFMDRFIDAEACEREHLDRFGSDDSDETHRGEYLLQQRPMPIEDLIQGLRGWGTDEATIQQCVSLRQAQLDAWERRWNQYQEEKRAKQAEKQAKQQSGKR